MQLLAMLVPQSWASWGARTGKGFLGKHMCFKQTSGDGVLVPKHWVGSVRFPTTVLISAPWTGDGHENRVAGL